MEPEPQHSQEAINDLLKKLRVAQDDILQSARSDSFEQYIRRMERHSDSGAKRAEYRDAFQFLKKAASLEEADLVKGLRKALPLFAEMKRFYPDEDEDCTALDYVSFAGSRIGEIPEDRFFLSHAADTAKAGEAARQNLALTEQMIRLALGVADDDLKSLIVRTLLGGIDYLRAEEQGLEEGGTHDASGESEIYAAAARYDVPTHVIDRAMRLTDSLARLMAERRKRKRK